MYQRLIGSANLDERDDLSASGDVVWLMRHPQPSLTTSGKLCEQQFYAMAGLPLAGQAEYATWHYSGTLGGPERRIGWSVRYR